MGDQIVEPFPGREMCNFCSERPTTQLYACKNFLIPQTKTALFQHESIGAWAACARCAELIDGGALVGAYGPRFDQLYQAARRPTLRAVRRPKAVPRDSPVVQRAPGQGELKCRFATTKEK
jgi:hypothetical protein